MFAPKDILRTPRHRYILVLGGLTLVLVAVSLLPLPSVVRLAIGSYLAWVAPGLLLVELLPWRQTLGVVERIGLAVVISLFLPPLIAFALFFQLKFSPETLRTVTLVVVAAEAMALLGVQLPKSPPPARLPTDDGQTTAPAPRPRQSARKQLG